MKKLILTIGVAAMITACGGGGGNQKAEQDHSGHDHSHASSESSDGLLSVPEGASVSFANLEDGAEVTSPLYVEFGAEGIKVSPAGEAIEGEGHHHIIIDADPIAEGEIVPANKNYKHYGGGQTGDTLTLEPGIHKLGLQFADGLHRSYGPQMYTEIKVIVAEAAE